MHKQTSYQISKKKNLHDQPKMSQSPCSTSTDPPRSIDPLFKISKPKNLSTSSINQPITRINMRLYLLKLNLGFSLQYIKLSVFHWTVTHNVSISAILLWKRGRLVFRKSSIFKINHNHLHSFSFLLYKTLLSLSLQSINRIL